MVKLIRALCPAILAGMLALPAGAQPAPQASAPGVQQPAAGPAATRTPEQRQARRRVRAERAAVTADGRRPARTGRAATTPEDRRAAREERARLAQARAAQEGGTLQAPAGMRPVR